MKRLAVLLMVVALMCGTVAGNAEGLVNESLASIFPLAETYTVSGFAFSNVGQELSEAVAWKKMEELTNVKWELTMVSQAELDEKRGLSFNSGEYYDVYIKSGISSVDTFKFAQQGIIIPLNDLIDEYMPNLKARLDEQGVWGDITSGDGKIYALPQLNGAELAAPVAFINQPWLDTLGLAMPTTTDEFLAVLRAFHEKDPNGNGKQDEYAMYCPQGAVSMFMPYFGIAMDYNTYCMYDHAGGTMTYVPTSEAYKEFLRFMALAYSEGLINPDCYSATWDDITAIGTTSDTIGCMATYGAYQHVGPDKDENFPMIMSFNGQKTIPAGKGVAYGALVITDKCANPEIICQWADYFYGEEGACLGRMGVEGETYTLDADGKYHWNTDGKYGADITTIRNAHTIFGWYPAPMAKAKLFDEGQTNEEELYLYKDRQRMLAYAADAYPALSWTEDEIRDKATLSTAINTYISEYEAQVVTGQLDLDASWDEFVANLKSMGQERVYEIDSAAYARWLAEQK